VDTLFDRNFGVIFQVKMTLLIIAIVLTAVHSFVIGPRMLRMQETVADESELARLRRISMIVSGVNLLVAVTIVFLGALLASNFALE
jgi:putative copper export protein